MTARELDCGMRLVPCALSRVRQSHWIDVRQTRPSSGVPIGRTRERDREGSFVCAGCWCGQCGACEFGFDRKLDQVANPHCRTRSGYAERHTEVRPFE